MGRKTIDREALIAKANKMLANSENVMFGERRGIISLVSDLLLEANSYKGFSYLATPSEPGLTVGIVPDYETGKHSYPDKTRVRFN